MVFFSSLEIGCALAILTLTQVPSQSLMQFAWGPADKEPLPGCHTLTLEAVMLTYRPGCVMYLQERSVCWTRGWGGGLG